MSRSVWAFSLLSALGALPFLALPAVTGSVTAAGLDAVRVLTAVAVSMTIGEFIAASTFPMVFGERFRVWHAVILLLSLIVLFGVSQWDDTLLSMLGWMLIGIAGGGLQFFGTTVSIAFSDPIRASQIRLSVSLVISGTAILLTATTVETGDRDPQFIFSTIFLLGLILTLTILSSDYKKVQKFENRRFRSNHDTKLSIITFASITAFFVIVPPYISALPAIIEFQPASLTLFQIGAAKIASGLILLAMIRFGKDTGHPYGVLFVSTTVMISAIITPLYPSVAIFTILELGLNISAIFIFGRYGEAICDEHRKWFFVFVQIGTIFGFIGLRFVEKYYITNMFPILISITPIVLIIICVRSTKPLTQYK